MLLIPCPYCGRAPGDRVPLRRRGAYRAAADPPSARRRGWADFLYLRTNPKGLHRRALAPHPWLRALLQRGARHGQRPHRRDLRGGEPQPATRRAQARRAGMSPAVPRPPAGGRVDRTRAAPLHLRRRALRGLRAATRSPRRCSPTACISSAARSNITGRAASWRPARRSRTRWSRSIAAAGAPRPTCARPRSSSTTASSRRARTAGRRCASTSARSTTSLSPLLPAGFYYKTFMWPRGVLGQRLYEPRDPRAPPGSARAPPSPIPTATLQRYAHCDVLVVGAGPAGLAAALAAAERGARVILCDEQAELGGSLLAETDGDASTAAPRRDWLAATLAALAADGQRHAPAAHDGLRLLRAQLRRRSPSASPTISPSPTADLPRERLWQVRAKRGRARHRRDRAAAGVPGQRPAGDHAGRTPRAPISIATASCPARKRRGRHRRRLRPIARRSTSTRRASRSPLIADLAPEGGALAADARAAGIRVETARRSAGRAGGCASRAVRLGRLKPRRLGDARRDASPATSC